MKIEEIKNAVPNAAGKKQKIAMFHLQILKHADAAVDGFNPTNSTARFPRCNWRDRA